MLWLLLIRQIKWICGFDPRNHRLLLRHLSLLTAAPSKCILSWFWCAFPTNLSINLSVQCAAAVKVPNIWLHRSGPCNPIRFSLLDNEINQLLFFRFIVHTVPSRQVPLLRWWMTAAVAALYWDKEGYNMRGMQRRFNNNFSVIIVAVAAERRRRCDWLKRNCLSGL